MHYSYIGIATTCLIACGAPAVAQTVLTATFARGAVAEYSNNPNGTDNGVLFSTLNISTMSISQSSANGSWGGTQGNDTAVTATINFTNGTSTSFPAAINWVKNAGTGQFDWVGVTIGPATTVNDGYNLTAGKEKTYVLQFSQSSLSLATLLPNGLDGSANTGQALNALNQYFPTAIASPPVITGPGGATGATAALSVNENQTAVTILSASKPVTWSISGGSDQARFAIATNGTITFLTAPDFEAPTDSDTNNSYVVAVRATDSDGASTVQTITVTVLDLDDTAPAIAAGQSLSYAENQIAGAQVGSVVATDAVGVTGFRFVATGTQTSADGYYTIDAAGAVRITAAGVAAGVANNDFETGANSFTLAVQARDAAGNWSASTDITLNVTDVAESLLVITGPGGATGATSAITVNENQTAVTTLTATAPVTWTITAGNDQARFAISTAGVISFIASPDFEAPTDSDTNNVYILAVTATDGGGQSVIQTISVTVADLADTPPVITGPGGSTGATSAITVNENQTAVTTVTANTPVTWTISGGNDQVRFAISPSGVITFVTSPDFEAPTDSDVNNGYVLTITATDGSGQTSTQTITVSVADVADTPPVITGPGGSTGPASAITINEGTTTVTTLTANKPVAWAITGGNDQSRFAVDAAGAITFAAAPDFEVPSDSDGNNVYILSVTATDANGQSVVQTVTVTVADIADTAPVITGPGGATGTASAITVSENQTAVTTLTASKPVTWAITGGNDQGRFAVGPSGEISFLAAPDFEAPTDSDTNNTYVLTLVATDATGQTSTQTLTVTVADVADTAPVITGPGGVTGTASAITVNENQTTVTTLSASKPVTWAITGGNDQGRFAIGPSGELTFVVAPDFEAPTDSDTNNSYILTLVATDATGQTSTQTVTVTVLNVADTPPVITGPGGSVGAASAVTVNENQLAATTLTASKPVTWAITGGNDRGRFAIAPNGSISFVTAPDFEAPTDSDTNNSYVLTVAATDFDGQISTQTLTITVADVADTAPVIAGPAGATGTTSAVTINEGTTAVSTLAANVPVAWAITGGNDRGRFAVNAAGQLSFVAAPDFETPTDNDTNNTYILTVRATDRQGNFAEQTITVTVVNVEEFQQRLQEIGADLRRDLRNHVFSSLGTMLSFNEDLLGAGSPVCTEASRRPLSGGINANERRQDASLAFRRDLSACGSRTRLFVDAGVGVTRVAGNWTTRGLGSLRVEHAISPKVLLGASLIGTTASDELGSFDNSGISDKSAQINLYTRAELASNLRLAGFGGLGRAWYSFRLNDDGLTLDGDVTGRRQIYGAALSGDIELGSLTVTTDAVVSRAVEKLGSARVGGTYRNERAAGVMFPLGSVDITRLSVPVHVPVIFGRNRLGRPLARVEFSPGLLCQDTIQDSSSLSCGYQLGLKAQISPSERGRLQAAALHEYVDGYISTRFAISFERRFFKDRLALGMGGESEIRMGRQNNGVFVRLGLSR